MCLCSKCRKVSGVASNANLMVGKDAFEWVSGEPALSKYHRPDGWAFGAVARAVRRHRTGRRIKRSFTFEKPPYVKSARRLYPHVRAEPRESPPRGGLTGPERPVVSGKASPRFLARPGVLFLGYDVGLDIRDVIAAKATEAGGRLTVRSALNPALWLCAIVSVPALALLASVNNPPLALQIAAIAPLAVAVFGFLFLLFFDRDKLQSEDFQLKKRSLELIEQKGERAIPADVLVEAIPEPTTPAIPTSVESETP